MRIGRLAEPEDQVCVYLADVNWQTKSRIQSVLSRAPLGDQINHLIQRYVTKSSPRTGAVLDEVVATAHRHHDNVRRFSARSPESCSTLEFGAGWDLATPIALTSLGIGHQTLLDVRRVARASLVRRVMIELIDRGDLSCPYPRRSTLEVMLRPLDIEYRAPSDARNCGLPDHSVDVALSTSTLEHIPPQDIRAIMEELKRVLRPDGICSFVVDYHDHYAVVDRSIHGLNFLRYSEREWQRWNCDLQYQNRLRHSDYLALFDQTGFEALDVEAISDRSLPAEIELDSQFSAYAPDDLRITDGWFVLRPR